MKNQENSRNSVLCSLYDVIHELAHEVYDLIKSVEIRYDSYKKSGYKGYDYITFNIVRGLKVKKYIIMLLLSLTFAVSFHVSANGVGDLEIEPLYEPTMTLVNDDLGKFNYNPFLRRLKIDVLENDYNFLGVDTVQSYDEVTSGGEQILISLQGADVTLPSALSISSNSSMIYSISGEISYMATSGIPIHLTDSFSQVAFGFNLQTDNPTANLISYATPTGAKTLSSTSYDISLLDLSGNDVANESLIQWLLSINATIQNGVYSGGETIEEITMSLSEYYSRNENFTHSNYWGITSNYVITNELLMGNNRGVDSLFLDYSNIVIYDEFIINYSQNNYSLIPTSVIVDIDTIDNITWVWNYKVQTDIGLTEKRTQSWSLSGQNLSDNKINVLPQSPLYNVSIDEMSEFIDTYGQNQFINLSSARVIIDFNTNVNEFDIIQYSVDKDVYNESNELAWYDFDSQGSVSNLGESLLESANNFLQLEIFPNFRILDILLIAIAIPMLIWVLKVFFGG